MFYELQFFRQLTTTNVNHSHVATVKSLIMKLIDLEEIGTDFQKRKKELFKVGSSYVTGAGAGQRGICSAKMGLGVQRCLLRNW